MKKFNPNGLRADAPHKVTVKLVYRNEAGEKEVVETEVFYRGLSLDTQDDFPTTEGKEGKERTEAVKQQLAALVVKIPDFGVGPAEDGFEVQPDAAFFGPLEDTHVNAIGDAIAEDRDPNVKSSNS